MSSDRFPIVDLAMPIEETVKALRSACTDTGFFYLKNHGIPSEVVDELFKKAKSFFELPMEEKMKVKANENHRGYTYIGEETLDPKMQKSGDTRESFYIGLHSPAGSEEAKRPLCGPNQWPSDDFPLGPQWRQFLEEHYDRMIKMSTDFNRITALSLDLPPDYFEPYFKAPFGALRMFRYTPAVSNLDKGILGCGAHSDYPMMTFLYTDNEPFTNSDKGK